MITFDTVIVLEQLLLWYSCCYEYIDCEIIVYTVIILDIVIIDYEIIIITLIILDTIIILSTIIIMVQLLLLM